MSFRILTRPLRSLLVKLHPFVSCCASCGEIKVPLEGRLCTSLAPAFFVDGVLAGTLPGTLPGTATEDVTDAAGLRQRMPWLRQTHSADTLASLTTLCESGALAEHFFIVFPDSRLARIRGILDLFTPNGLPLLAVTAAKALPAGEAAWCAFLEEKGFSAGRGASFANDVYPMTRECLQGFLSAYGEFCAGGKAGETFSPDFSLPDIFPALARWVFAAAMGIPAGSAHPLAARERT